MPVASPRQRRVGDQIQKEISELLLREIKDPRIGFVTLTGVEVSGDLRLAKVFYTVLGEAGQRDATAKALVKAAPFMRRELGRRLRLRFTPELSFHYDASLEYGNRIDSLLKELNDHDDDRD